MEELQELMVEAVRRDASDIHLKVGAPPTLRIYGMLVPLTDRPGVTREWLVQLTAAILDGPHRRRFENDMQVDLAFGLPEAGRFRVNVFRERGEPRVALRVLPPRIRTIQELNLPPVLERIALENRGLVLVTGTTGSGKSTTLAAMIQHINLHRSYHIITIEDPIEYTHGDYYSLISQREVGYDAPGFAEALKGALRQDPDVILVGEMRDLETIGTAILAAETGHLVMSTLHTLDAPETITRIISAFPEDQRDQIRLILANILKGVISQRLVPRADGAGMVPAVEVLVSTARIRECIAQKEKAREIHEAMAVGFTTYGMQTFDQSLMTLYRQGLISYEEALSQATNPEDFALKVRGIASASDARWADFDKAYQQDKTGEKIERFHRGQ